MLTGELALTFPILRMRCGLPPMTRVAWSALIVLMLEALPTDAFAQSPVCHAIRRGESATQAARRIDRQRPERVSGVVPDHERLVEVRSQVAIRPYSCRLAGLRRQPAIRSRSSNANHVEAPEAANASEAPNGSGVPEITRGAQRHSRAPTPAMAPSTDRSPPPPTSFARSAVSISRCCGFALRWLCRGSGGGWSTTISLAGRRHPSSCGTLSIDSSMSSNGHWFGTASRSVP